MSTWLEPLRMALDQAAQPVDFFFRDDDAGWGDEPLQRLLDQFAEQAIPLDLAVIPQALSEPLAERLKRRCDVNRSLLGLHQHGYRHTNHEPAGRKYEFGPSRSGAQQYRDLRAGAERLRALLGRRVDPIFTPPWNRCTAQTVDALAELGYRALSRDVTAKALPLPSSLRECPVNVDWQRRRHGQLLGREALGQQLAVAVRGALPVGVMLHHAAMNGDDFIDLHSLLATLNDAAQARCCLLRELVSNPPPSDERWS